MSRKITRKPTHPGEIIKEEYMTALRLTVTALSNSLGVSRKTLSTIVNERSAVISAGLPDRRSQRIRGYAVSTLH
jgi:addiction module HigA family antidote